MSKCELCSNEGSKSTIVNAKYYRSICDGCYDSLLTGNSVSSGHADYERGRDAEDHEADIMQPLGPGGIPSAEFIKLYPDTAKKIFTREEISRAIRA